jgi:PBP1b-binding outer membrane lipoprotein LpoB
MKITLVLLLTAAALTGCSKDETAPVASSSAVTVTDASLYMLIKSTASYQFYKNSSDTLAKNNGTSGHTEPKMRTKYNAKAASQLDANGKVKASPNFPDSSLIVKEIINTDGSLSYYAVMFKLRSADNADGAGTWVWAKVGPTGSALYSTGLKGAGCTGCHASAFDFTRMNDSHP